MTDEPVTVYEAPTSDQAKRRKEQATVTDNEPGDVREPEVDLDDDKLEEAREDVKYVNELLSGEF